MLRILSRNVYSFGYYNNINLSTSGSTFKSGQMSRQYRKQLLPIPDYNDPQALPFGKYSTDHMIHVNWDLKAGWAKPKLEPFRDLNLSPFCSGLHYGIQLYEGTKAYKNEKGQIRLFRPQCNAFRMKKSSVRVTLPDFDGKQLLNLMEELIKLQERWIPPKSEYSLYIRPFAFSIDDALGVKKPDKAKLMIVTSPVGPYYSTGFKPVSLYCATDSIRSAPKGTGAYKLGGNYAPSIKTSTQAEKRGHQQVLWLFEGQVCEVGSCNIFFAFKNKGGDIEIVTPQIEDMILPGVTRDSVLQLLRDKGEYKVTQRKIYIDQIIQRQKKGELLQAFGAGTAVIISSIKNMEYEGQHYSIPYDKELNFGKIAFNIRKELLDIQEGRIKDRFGWIKRLK